MRLFSLKLQQELAAKIFKWWSTTLTRNKIWKKSPLKSKMNCKEKEQDLRTKNLYLKISARSSLYLKSKIFQKENQESSVQILKRQKFRQLRKQTFKKNLLLKTKVKLMRLQFLATWILLKMCQWWIAIKIYNSAKAWSKTVTLWLLRMLRK